MIDLYVGVYYNKITVDFLIYTGDRQLEKRCIDCGHTYDRDLEKCPMCNSIKAEKVEQTEDFPELKGPPKRIRKKKKHKNKKALILSVCIASTVICITLMSVLAATSAKRSFGKADVLIDKGEYIAAIELLSRLDESKNKSIYISRAIERMQKDIEKAISDKDTAKAVELNEKYGGYIPDAEKNTEVIRQNCTHEASKEEKRTASCETDGYQRSICSLCGLVTEKIFDAPGHNYVNESTVEATCSEPGKIFKTCTACGKNDSETLSALPHTNLKKIKTPPTCTAEGEYLIKCTVCGEESSEAIPITDHSYISKVTKAATCTEKGEETYTCSYCSYSYTKETDSAEHQYESATCLRPKTCTVCGDTVGSKLSRHQWQNAGCTVPATCRVCKTTRGSAAGHKWVDATFTAPKTCSVCGATEGECVGSATLYVRSALPHTITERAADGTEYQKHKVTEVTYSQTLGYDGYIDIILYFSGEKTYDKDGEGREKYISIPYRIYDADGRLVTSGTASSSPLSLGEGYSEVRERVYYNFTSGVYYIELSDEAV